MLAYRNIVATLLAMRSDSLLRRKRMLMPIGTEVRVSVRRKVCALPQSDGGWRRRTMGTPTPPSGCRSRGSIAGGDGRLAALDGERPAEQEGSGGRRGVFTVDRKNVIRSIAAELLGRMR